jgi:hypothetical protein
MYLGGDSGLCVLVASRSFLQPHSCGDLTGRLEFAFDPLWVTIAELARIILSPGANRMELTNTIIIYEKPT